MLKDKSITFVGKSLKTKVVSHYACDEHGYTDRVRRYCIECANILTPVNKDAIINVVKKLPNDKYIIKTDNEYDILSYEILLEHYLNSLNKNI